MGQPLSKRGWMVTPHENRYLLFDGRVLHGVVPGNGAVAHDGGVAEGSERRRITLMVAFWASIEHHSSYTEPGAARPFPVTAALGKPVGKPTSDSAAPVMRWPTLCEWPRESDLGGAGASAGGAAGDAVSAPLRFVQPVWELAPLAAERPLHSVQSMPEYDECFQGLC